MRLSQHPKEESFNFRVNPKLKAAFQKATEAEDKPARPGAAGFHAGLRGQGASTVPRACGARRRSG